MANLYLSPGFWAFPGHCISTLAMRARTHICTQTPTHDYMHTYAYKHTCRYVHTHTYFTTRTQDVQSAARVGSPAETTHRAPQRSKEKQVRTHEVLPLETTTHSLTDVEASCVLLWKQRTGTHTGGGGPCSQ